MSTQILKKADHNSKVILSNGSRSWISDRDTLLQAVISLNINSQILILITMIRKCHWFDQLGKEMWHSHDQIGIESNGYCRQTVLKVLKTLEQLGLLRITSRAKDTTSNIHKLNPFIYIYLSDIQNILSEKLKKRGLNRFIKKIQFLSITIITLLFGIALPKENLTPNSNYLFINNRVYNYNNTSRCITLDSTRIFKKTIKKRSERSQRLKEAMEISTLKSNALLDEIEQGLHLTKLGKAKLFAFEHKALQANWHIVKSMLSKLDDPYKYLMVKTIRYCEEQSIVIDWEIYYLILKRYKMVDNKQYVKPKITKTIKPLSESTFISQINDKYKNKAPNNYWLDLIGQSNPELKQSMLDISSQFTDSVDIDEEKRYTI